MPGHDYEPRFWLYGHEADVTGMFFRVGDQDAGKVLLDEVTPRPAALYGNPSPTPEPLESCTECSWLDAQYLGEPSDLITIKVKANPAAGTRLNPVNWFYRSYVVRGNQVLRYPKDEVLGDKPDKPLVSGYYAESLEIQGQTLRPASMCSKKACITIEFSQGTGIGPNEGFTARNRFDAGGWEPLLAHYRIELFEELGDAAKIVFASQAEHLQLESVSFSAEDLFGESKNLECNTLRPTRTQKTGSSFSLSAARFKRCVGYAAEHTISGVIALKPLAPTQKTVLSMSLEDGGSKTEYLTWVKVSSKTLQEEKAEEKNG